MLYMYDISLLMHSLETGDWYGKQRKRFLNLDDNTLGIGIDQELNTMCFFIFKEKKTNIVKYHSRRWNKDLKYRSAFIKLNCDFYIIWRTLNNLIYKYYENNDRLIRDDIPTYTQMEMQKICGHVWYHIQAGTLNQLLEKEVIYN